MRACRSGFERKHAAALPGSAAGCAQQVDYPAIARRAKAEQAVVQWADETAVRQDTSWVRGYAAAGAIRRWSSTPPGGPRRA